MRMGTTSFLFQSLLLFFIVTRYVDSLRSGGRNVRTRYVSYYTTLATSTTARTTNGRTCTRTCSWSCCYCRRCRTLYKTKWVTTYYTARRYRPEYYCAPGWRPRGDECTSPICTAGCFNGGTCVLPERCSCRTGWQGSNCRTDVNECATNNGGCQQHCHNRVGSYNCTCDAGYNLVGKHTCQDINECLGANRCQQRCVNNPGNYSCDCHAGYLLNNDNTTCSDIDECLPRNNTPSACQYKCNNTVGSFFCTCPKGYLLTSNARDCADHDECVTGNHTCQQRCLNYPGHYQCACHSGFRLNNDNRSCADVDECKEKTAGCAHKCNNTIGSFQCLCPTGYFLNSDNRTCYDHDECQSGKHRCNQICGNTPGSYYCSCRPGYHLDTDFRTCKGYPCSSIPPPVKGFVNCTGLTMDSVCKFSCKTGFELIGSLVRACLVNGQWSGQDTSCKVKQCNKPSPPVNGYIRIPCSTIYKGKCSFSCNAGHFLNGSQSVSCSADSKWEPSPGNCQAITVCHPNPCQHGGVCEPVNSTAFRCNCTDTAYTGSKCHLGFVRTPTYPRLQVGNNVTISFEFSPPDNDLTFEPMAAGVEFKPRVLSISPAQIERGKIHVANMTMLARMPGIHLISYKLSGLSANTYQSIGPNAVSVIDNGTSCNDTLDPILPVGCHEMTLFKCPRSDNVLSVKSTELWKRNKKGTASTNGIVTLVSPNLTVPLGIRGATFQNTNHSSIQTSKGQCKNDLSVDVQCLPTETLASDFLQSLTASFPSWFRLTPSKTLAAFKAIDMITYIWTGKELKGVLEGLGLSVNEESYYSVLLYANAITVEVNKSSVKLPSSDKNTYLLVAAELCSQSMPGNVLVVFNPFSSNGLKSMPIYQHLKTQGWDITALGLQFSTGGSLVYSVNTSYKSNTQATGNLELYGTVEKFLNGSNSLPIHSLGIHLVGNVILQLPDTKELFTEDRDTWTAGLRGDITVNMSLILLKREFVLTVPLKHVSGLVQYQGTQKGNTCKISDSYSLLSSGHLSKNPFLTNPVGSFIESANSTLSFFAYTRGVNNSFWTASSRSAFHIGFHLDGTARFGPLKFPNMSIKAEIYSENFDECNGESKVPGLEVSATFNRQESLGRFFISSDTDSLQIFAPSNSENTTTGMFNTTVALLANSFQARVNLANDSLAFQTDLHFFQKYPASVNVSSRLQPWETLVLQVTGIFPESKKNGSRVGLIDNLEGMINNYVKVVAENTFSRLNILQSAGAKMNGRIDRSKARLYHAENSTHAAAKKYLSALKDEQAALQEVKMAERRVSNGSLELIHMKAALENLCSIDECPYVCVSGTSCNTCYKDLISKEQGLCPATCHDVEKERLRPFETTGTCVKDDCDKPGGFDSLVSTLSCSMNPKLYVDSIIKTAAPYVIAGALTYVGVPPQYSVPIGKAVVTYVDTKDEKEALESGVKSVVSPSTFEKDLGKAMYKDVQDGCGDGEWKCTLIDFPCPKPVFTYKFTNIPYSCEISCEVNVITETIASPCCSEVNCASRAKDTKCREKNAFCRIVRVKALSKLNTAQRNLMKPLNELQQVKKKHQVAEIALAKMKIELEAASSNRDTIRRAHQAIVTAANISKQAEERNRALIKDAIILAQLWNSTNNTCPVEMKEASFDVALSSPSETQIPVLFRAISKAKEITISPIINFARMDESLEQTAQRIVKELFGKVNLVLRSEHPINQFGNAPTNKRKKRALDEGNTDVTRLVEFKRKCSMVTNYRTALSDIIGSLYNISTEALQLLNNAANYTMKTSHAETNDLSVNATQAASFGLSIKDVEDSKQALTSDEEIANASRLFELRNSTNLNKVQTAIDMVFGDWEASMESVFNFSSLECNGFIDCMEDFVDNLFYIYNSSSLPEAVQLQQKVAVLEKEVKSLVSFEDLSVAEAAEKSRSILKMLRDIKDEKVFCATAPNITTHPVSMKDMKLGQKLELSCAATGNPASSYRWRKNGVLLEGRNTNTLTIDKVTTNDSGNYICEAYNHVTVKESTPAYVSVHVPPTLTNQPPGNLNVPVNTRVFMLCNATSVAQPLRYQWLYKLVDGDAYSIVPNATSPVIRFGPAKKHQEGFYKCNVSSPYDFTLSREARVRVLDFSLVVPSMGLNFKVVGDNQSLHNAYKDSKAPRGERPKDVGLLVSNENFRQDLASSFVAVFNNLVSTPSNAVQNFTVEDCESIDEDSNITCHVSFHLRSFNVTGPESLNKTEEENALSVMESVKQLENFAVILVNESLTKGLSLNARGISLEIDPSSWSVGEYTSICPIGQVLFESNFACVNCPPGTRGTLNGTSPACLPCPSGTFQSKQGQKTCVPCPSGFTSSNTGLENVNSCKESKPESTTTKPTTFLPPESTTTKPTTFLPPESTKTLPSRPTASTEQVETKPSDGHRALGVKSDHDATVKWKIAFGTSIVIVAILLAGVAVYAVNYRVKRVRRFKTSKQEKQVTSKVDSTDQIFENPVYGMPSGIVEENTTYGHDNPIYNMEDLPCDEKQ